MSESSNPVASFVKGFFSYLDGKRIEAAVLHGWLNDFEGELSDVDFVIETPALSRIAGLIESYCSAVGWRLCQVLRHETTAAFCVCSAMDDPSCAVALDACSDYQRNDTFFLSAEFLLNDRMALPWGGFRLSDTAELCYRFAKAAAKAKDPITAAAEFSVYPEESRCACATWLEKQWAITLASWDVPSLTLALAQLRAKSNRRPSLLHAGTLTRILSRILTPTGLVVITGHEDYDTSATRLEQVFGHLYFRRTLKAAHWQPGMLKDLISTTLIVLPEIGTVWEKIIPADCIYRLEPTQDGGTQCREIAEHLHERCKLCESRRNI